MKAKLITMLTAIAICGTAMTASADNFFDKLKAELQKVGAGIAQMDPAQYAELQRQREEARHEFESKIKEAIKDYLEGFRERHKIYAQLLKEYVEMKLKAFFNRVKEEVVAKIKDKIEDLKDEIEKKKAEHETNLATIQKEYTQKTTAINAQLSMMR